MSHSMWFSDFLSGSAFEFILNQRAIQKVAYKLYIPKLLTSFVAKLPQPGVNNLCDSRLISIYGLDCRFEREQPVLGENREHESAIREERERSREKREYLHFDAVGRVDEVLCGERVLGHGCDWICHFCHAEDKNRTKTTKKNVFF